MGNKDKIDEELRREEIYRVSNFEGDVPEPKKGILTDDEILKYAGNSKAASKIRLNRGIGDNSDRFNLYSMFLFELWFSCGWIPLFLILLGGISNSNSLMLVAGLLIVICMILITIYLLFFIDRGHQKNLKSNNSNKSTTYKKSNNSKKNKNNPKKTTNKQIIVNSSNNDLKVYKKFADDFKELYKIKEKMAFEIVEKRFDKNSLTYERFVSVINTCNHMFYNQYKSIRSIIKLSNNDNEVINEEIERGINRLKLLIEKLDELTNELVVNLSATETKSDIEMEALLEEMESLIGSVKDYK